MLIFCQPSWVITHKFPWWSLPYLSADSRDSAHPCFWCFPCLHPALQKAAEKPSHSVKTDQKPVLLAETQRANPRCGDMAQGSQAQCCHTAGHCQVPRHALHVMSHQILPGQGVFGSDGSDPEPFQQSPGSTRPSTERGTVLRRQQQGATSPRIYSSPGPADSWAKPELNCTMSELFLSPPTPVAGCNISRLLSWWQGLNVTCAAPWPPRSRNHHQVLTPNITPARGLGICHGTLCEEFDLQIYRCISEKQKKK